MFFLSLKKYIYSEDIHFCVQSILFSVKLTWWPLVGVNTELENKIFLWLPHFGFEIYFFIFKFYEMKDLLKTFKMCQFFI